MPYFISCTVPSVYYQGQTVENIPVNLSLCKSIQKYNFAWYPDNIGLPGIKFSGNDVEWLFETTDERNRELARIVAIQTTGD